MNEEWVGSSQQSKVKNWQERKENEQNILPLICSSCCCCCGILCRGKCLFLFVVGELLSFVFVVFVLCSKHVSVCVCVCLCVSCVLEGGRSTAASSLFLFFWYYYT